QDEISERRAVSLTNIQNPKKAYQALTEDPQFAEIISSIPYRYPGQLMEAFGYVFVFIILYLLYWKTEARKKPGFLFGLFLLLLMTVRLVVENFKREQVEGREDWIFNLNTGQVLSIPFILIGLYFVITAFTKKPINETN
ncbi:prolipoprotein diacylglyceryl transferase family protein, partial [Dokdonia donghaensis]